MEKIDAVYAADQIKAAFDQFRSRMEELDFQSWIPDAWLSDTFTPKEQVIQHICHLGYRPEQDWNETTLLPGIVLANKEVVDCVSELNAAKLHFRGVLDAFKKELAERAYRAMIADVFHRRGWNLVQVYRQLKIEVTPVKTTSFSWVIKDTALEKLTAEEAEQYARRRIQNEDILEMILKAISSVDGTIYTKRLISPHVQLNMRHFEAKPTKCKVHSPVFLVQDEFPKLPKKPLGLEPPEARERKVRRDQIQVERIYKGLSLYYLVE